MDGVLLSVLGGLGLFLFGIKIMTLALSALAGDRLHHWLARVTDTPVRGVATGASVTALIQSSSATTVAVVSFVGAGLLSFQQALGVIFGANIGTTVTGWIVALIGFKVKLGVSSLAGMFLGALFVLLGKGKWSIAGKALCGFSLLFLGIDYLKNGLSGLASEVDFTAISASPLVSQILFFAVGVLLSLLTQSSSSTIASALVAVNSEIVSLPQCLAMIVGADVGTTFTAWLATLGSSLESRRTGLSHVIYNLLTGAAAFSLIPLYYHAWQKVAPAQIMNNPELVAVAYHTSFNILGVIVVLPFTSAFARCVCRWVQPKKGALFPLERLDDSLLASCGAAEIALHAKSRQTARSVLKVTQSKLSGSVVEDRLIDEMARYVRHLQDFAMSLAARSERFDPHEILHGLDHLDRLLSRLKQSDRIDRLREAEVLECQLNEFRQAVSRVLGKPLSEGFLRRLSDLAEDISAASHRSRCEIIEHSLAGGDSYERLDGLLDAYRWLKRSAYHLERIAAYFVRLDNPYGEVEKPQSM